MDLSNVKILSFDCYGTLIDWETGLLNTLSSWIKEEGINKTDEDTLELFSKIEPQVQAESIGLNYRKVLATVISKMGEQDVKRNRYTYSIRYKTASNGIQKVS